MDKYTLHLGDCLEYMRGMEAGSVDVVITDPPYLIHAGAGGGAFGKRDHLVNTGGFTDMGVNYSFLDRFDNWVCFCSKMQLAELISIAERKEHWNLITYAKTNPVPTCNNKYLPDVEYIIHGYRNGNLYGDYDDKQSFYLSKIMKKETDHPNEKPITLINKLIKLSSKPGDLIFDPFMGSGTTGVACMQLGRRFIGCEINPGYFKIAKSRIEKASRQMLLFSNEKEDHRESKYLQESLLLNDKTDKDLSNYPPHENGNSDMEFYDEH